MRTRAEHFPLFDALRGIAALFVLTYHGLYQPATYAGQGDWWWRYAIHLDVAVPIFLGISGFLLYRPFVSARLGGRPPPSLGRYGIRRALRIVPGYWFALTVLALWFWVFPPGFEEVRSLGGALRYYGFAQIYDADTAVKGIGQAWTLGVEVVFYLALPLWIVLMHRLRASLRTELLGLAALVVISIAWKVLVLSRVDPTSERSLSALLPMPTWIDHFAIGMGLAALSVAIPRPPRLLWLAWPAAFAFWLCAVFVAGPDGSPQDPVTDRIYLLRHVFYTLFVACLLVPAVWREPGAGLAGRVLAWRPFAYIGTISLSFYLFHFAWIRQQARWWDAAPVSVGDWTLWMATLLAGSLVLGTIGFRLVEAPAMRWRPWARSDPPASPGPPP